MAQKSSTGSTKGKSAKAGKPGREDRLKAALKANMARRKAQARARMGADEDGPARMGADEEGCSRSAADEQDHAEKTADTQAEGKADG